VSQENVEIVRRAVEAFGVGGIEAVVSLTPEDVVWYPFPEWVEEPEYRGHDGVRRVTAVSTDNFDDFGLSAEEVREVGDRVLVLGETAGRIKDSGVPIRQPLGIVYSDFRNGQAGEARFFLTWRQALEAVGLRE
jgi:ketosteroid isomerase-like protein